MDIIGANQKEEDLVMRNVDEEDKEEDFQSEEGPEVFLKAVVSIVVIFLNAIEKK